jgi:ABC-type cobalamin/Fe3+-siderophores transport system ATPase subunit
VSVGEPAATEIEPRVIVVLNGPLGIGKTTLAEVLAESIKGCVMLDGDHLVAANPPAADEMEHLHSTIDSSWRITGASGTATS